MGMPNEAGFVVDIGGVNWADLGGWGAFIALAVLIVIAFLRGAIVPRGTLELFKQAWEKALSANEEQGRALNELLDSSRASTRMLEAIQRQGAAPVSPEIRKTEEGGSS